VTRSDYTKPLGGGEKEDNENKRKVTSLTLGTGGKRLWLLRSRPDQVDRPSMRGGPSRRILSSSRARRDPSCAHSSSCPAAAIERGPRCRAGRPWPPGYRPRTTD